METVRYSSIASRPGPGPVAAGTVPTVIIKRCQRVSAVCLPSPPWPESGVQSGTTPSTLNTAPLSPARSGPARGTGGGGGDPLPVSQAPHDTTHRCGAARRGAAHLNNPCCDTAYRAATSHAEPYRVS